MRMGNRGCKSEVLDQIEDHQRNLKPFGGDGEMESPGGRLWTRELMSSMCELGQVTSPRFLINETKGFHWMITKEQLLFIV